MDILGKKRYLLYLLAFLTAVGVTVLLNGPFLRSKPEYPVTLLPDGWTVQYQGQTMTDIALIDANIGQSRAGDVFTAYRTLPENEINNACVRVLTALSALDVYVDDVLLYSYGHDRGEAGRMIPTRLHFVPLPANYGGKELRFEVSVYTDKSFSGLGPIAVGNRKDLQLQMIQEYRMPLFSGLFLVIFAFVLLVMSVYLVVYETSSVRIYFSAALLLILGFYILSFYDLIDLLTNRAELRTLLEYGSLYLLTSGTTGFVATMQEGFMRRILAVLCGIVTVLALVTYALHAMNIIFLYEALTFFQIVSVAVNVPMFIYVGYSLFTGRKIGGRRKSDVHLRASEMALLGGMSYLFIATMIDLARYAYTKFFSNSGSAYTDITMMTHGALVFAGCLIVNYFYFSIDFINAQMVHDRMRGLAYTDTLTNLANRTRCEEVMQRLNSGTDAFIVVSLDVNDLKGVNDSLGHTEGDSLISGFGEMLTSTFGSEAYLIGRMGGDEFIAIFTEQTYAQVQGLLEALTERMRQENMRGHRAFSYDAAWGIATSDEIYGGSAHDVYMLADTRMYANKMARKRSKELSRKLVGGRQIHG